MSELRTSDSCTCQTVSDEYSDHRFECPVYVAGKAARIARTAGTKPTGTSKKRLSPERQRMRRIVENFQHYVATYSKQEHFDSYSDTIFIDDMLYGIGIAIDKAHYEFADGFAKFKEVIRERLPDETPTREQLLQFAQTVLAGTSKDGLYNGRSPDELWSEFFPMTDRPSDETSEGYSQEYADKMRTALLRIQGIAGEPKQQGNREVQIQNISCIASDGLLGITRAALKADEGQCPAGGTHESDHYICTKCGLKTGLLGPTTVKANDIQSRPLYTCTVAGCPGNHLSQESVCVTKSEEGGQP